MKAGYWDLRKFSTPHDLIPTGCGIKAMWPSGSWGLTVAELEIMFAPLIIEVWAGLCWAFFIYILVNMRTNIKRAELDFMQILNGYGFWQWFRYCVPGVVSFNAKHLKNMMLVSRSKAR